MRKASSFRNNQKRVSVLIAKREGSCKRAAKSCRIGTVHMVINRKSATPRKSPWNQNFCQGGRRRLDVFRANVLVPYCFITQSKVIVSFEPANHAKWSLSLKIVMIRLHLCRAVSNITCTTDRRKDQFHCVLRPSYFARKVVRGLQVPSAVFTTSFAITFDLTSIWGAPSLVG